MTAPLPPVPQPTTGITPILMPPDAVPDRQGVMVIMSERRKDGDWVLPRLFRALTVMGNATIDLSQVRIAPGTSEIEVRAIMAEVKIIVPHNLRVECDGTPVLGEFKLKRVSTAVPVPDAPLVRITGVSVMSSVSVKVIDPNAPSWVRRLRGLTRQEGED
jgi:hypothetical protein